MNDIESRDQIIADLSARIDDLEAKVERLTSDRAGWKQVDAILQIMDTAKVFATSGPPDWRALSAVEQVQSLVDERDALQSEVERIKADKEKQAIKETSEPFDYRDNMRLGWAPEKEPRSEQEREAIVKLLKFYEEENKS